MATLSYSRDDIVRSITLGLVTILVISTVKRGATKHHDERKLYHDKDGTATLESQLHAERKGRLQSCWALAGAFMGVVVQTLNVLVLQSARVVNVDLTVLLLWVLLFIQTAAVVYEVDVLLKYRGAHNAVISCVAMVLYFTYRLTSEQIWFPYDVISCAALFFSTASLASIPRRPVLYVGPNVEVVNRQGASLWDWLSFSYGFLHRSHAVQLPSKLSLDDVPVPDFDLRAKTVRERFQGLDQFAKLWINLIRLCYKPLLRQWLFVALKTCFEFGSRYALFSVLKQLEISPDIESSKPDIWVWVGLLGFSFLGDAMADVWLLWTTAGVLYESVTAIVQTLVFEKMTRVCNFTLESSSEKTGHHTAPASAEDLIFNESGNITKAFLANYHFPMVVLKILLDVFYLLRLLGIKSLATGLAFFITTLLLSNNNVREHQDAQAEHAKSKSRGLGLLTEALQNLHQIRLSFQEAFWQHNLTESRVYEQEKRWTAALALQKLNFFAGLGPTLFAAVAISCYALETRHLTPSVAFTALSLFSNLHEVFSVLPEKLSVMRMAWLSFRKVQQYLDQPEISSGAVASDSIFFDDARLSWSQSRQDKEETDFELRNVTLHFPTGGLSVVTGRVGSGKSLLLAALLDEAVLLSGKFGKPIMASQDKSANPKQALTAYVSQPPWIDNCTIKENILFGYDFDRVRYEKIIVSCALDVDFALLKNGDKTMAGEGGSSLSGGQKWRVALARALYSPAEILVLEDVLGAVDTTVAQWLTENALTGELAQGRTIILATHRPEFCMSSAGYIITVENGTAIGEVQTIVGHNPVHTPNVHTNIQESILSSGNNDKSEGATDITPAPVREGKPEPVLANRAWWKTAILYLQAAGLRPFILGISATICHQLIATGHTWWLTKWSESDFSDQLHATAVNVSIYLFLSICTIFLAVLQSLATANIGIAASRYLFQHAIGSILTATIAWIDKTPFGQLFQNLDVDIHILDDLVATAINGILGTVLHLVFILVTSLYSNGYTAFSSITILLVYAHFAPRMMASGRKLRPLLGPSRHSLINHTNSTILGLTTIRAFNKPQLYIDHFLQCLDTASKVGLHIQIGLCWTRIRSGFVGASFVTAAAAAMVHARMSAATAGFTISLALQLRSVLQRLISQYATIQMGLAATDRVLALTEVPPESKSGRVLQNWPANGAVVVKNLSVQYSAESGPVLNKISFSLGPRQRLAIVGRTGAGKSSMANALLRVVEASEGQILIDSKDIADITLQQLRSFVKLIPQDPFLYSGTLRANLDPSGSKSDEQLLSALRRAHLVANDDHNSAPLGTGADFSNLDLAIKTGGSNISHGQRQLICLARAMLANCRVLILDESTSGIDKTTDAAIEDIISKDFADTTVFIIAHKLLTASQCDMILVLNNGHVVEFGKPATLLQNKGDFWDMVNCSADKADIEAAIHSKADLNIASLQN